MSRATRLVFLSAALAALSGPLASAQTPEPGSVLVYPIVDSSIGSGTLVSITNTKDDPSFNEHLNLNGVVDVHFVYIDFTTWAETNRFERLTPNDTFSVIAEFHNPTMSLGFLYCVALDPSTQEPVSHNWLIGDEIVADASLAWLYGIEAIAFKAKAADGSPADTDGDGLIDLDGMEYEGVPDQLLLSSFIAQGAVFSELVLVSLIGDGDYTTFVDFQVYNNNEVEFSATLAFRCWEKARLDLIDLVFTDQFLQTTMLDSSPNGLLLGTTGWARLDGDRALDAIGNKPKLVDPPFVGSFAQSIIGYAVGRVLHGTEADNALPGVLES